jgi:hypothetical protein
MSRVRQRAAFDPVLVFGAGLILLIVAAGDAWEGRRMAADQDLAEAQIIAGEDHDVCRRLASGPETDRLAQCAIELSWVRGQERRPIAARTAVLP